MREREAGKRVSVGEKDQKTPRLKQDTSIDTIKIIELESQISRQVKLAGKENLEAHNNSNISQPWTQASKELDKILQHSSSDLQKHAKKRPDTRKRGHTAEKPARCQRMNKEVSFSNLRRSGQASQVDFI